VLLVIAILPTLLLVLLCVPITVAFRVGSTKEIRGHVIFRWLFGLTRFQLSLPVGAKAGQHHKRTSGEKTVKRKSKPGGKVRSALTLLKQGPFRQRAIRFIRSLLGAIHGRDLYLRMRIGLGDPADTGRLWGFLGPVAGIAANFHSAEVRIEPEFADPVLEIESHGEFRLIPLQCIGLAAAFVMSPASLHAWFLLHRGNA